MPLAAGGAPATARTLAGYPYPVEEVAVRPLEGLAIVEVTLPVGGTAIASNGLYGVWQVEAAIADGPSCFDPATFTLGE